MSGGDILFTLHPELGYADLSLDDTGRDLERDETLETAVLISLGTNRRADEDDELPDGSENRRGWWADVFTAENNELIGSRLWLIDRSSTVDIALAEAEEYTREALQWMINASIVGSIDITVEEVIPDDVTSTNNMELKMTIILTRPSGAELPLQYFYNWEAQILRRVG